jgi:hypothetical protein
MHLVQSMAYVNETPWHGLGNQLATNQPIEVWAQQAGMNSQIEEAEVRFVSGNAGSSLGSIHAFPEQKVLYRSDTKMPLSVVSARYQVVHYGLRKAGVDVRAGFVLDPKCLALRTK